MPDPVTLIDAREVPDARWDQAVLALGGYLYHTSHWRRLLCAAYPGMDDVSVGFCRGERLVALLPLIRVRRLGFSKVFSMPFSLAGPLGEESAEITRLMLAYLARIGHSTKLNCRRQPEGLAGMACHAHRVAEADLARTEEDLWAGLGKSLRSDVKAKQAEVNLRPAATPEDLASIQQIYQTRMKLLGSPGTYTNTLFAGILDLPVDLRHVTILSSDGLDVAFNIAFCFGAMSFYFANASLPGYNRLCASSKLMWEDLRWARAQGATIHYLGGGLSGAVDESLFQFKIRWGRESCEYNLTHSFGFKGWCVDRLQAAASNRLVGLSLRLLGVR